MRDWRQATEAGGLSIAVSSDGKTFAESGDGTAEPGHSATGRTIWEIDGLGPGPVAYSPDGRFLAAGDGTHNSIVLIDVSSGTKCACIPGHTVFSYGG